MHHVPARGTHSQVGEPSRGWAELHCHPAVSLGVWEHHGPCGKADGSGGTQQRWPLCLVLGSEPGLEGGHNAQQWETGQDGFCQTSLIPN